MKKSYKGFVLWLFLFLFLVICLPFLPIQDEAVAARLVYLLCALAVSILMLMIYITEQVYWINGISYQMAVAAGPERRKACAQAYLKRFGLFSLLFILYLCLTWFFFINLWLDLVVFCVGFIATVISTIHIKL